MAKRLTFLECIKHRKFNEANGIFARIMQSKVQRALTEEKKSLVMEGEKYTMCPDCELSFKVSNCKGGKFPEHFWKSEKHGSEKCDMSGQSIPKEDLKEAASAFQCQECGKKFSREVDECPKCGSSDIDVLSESTKLNETLDPTKMRHIFSTTFGIPPGDTDPPICGAHLPKDWTSKGNTVKCPACLQTAKKMGKKVMGESINDGTGTLNKDKKGNYFIMKSNGSLTPQMIRDYGFEGVKEINKNEFKITAVDADDIRDAFGSKVVSIRKASVNESATIVESKFRITYTDGTSEEFTGSASDVRKKVKDSKKEVDDVETIG